MTHLPHLGQDTRRQACVKTRAMHQFVERRFQRERFYRQEHDIVRRSTGSGRDQVRLECNIAGRANDLQAVGPQPVAPALATSRRITASSPNPR